MSVVGLVYPKLVWLVTKESIAEFLFQVTDLSDSQQMTSQKTPLCVEFAAKFAKAKLA